MKVMVVMNIMVVMDVMDVIDVMAVVVPIDTLNLMDVMDVNAALSPPVPCWEAGTEETVEELSSHIGVSPGLQLLLHPTLPE